MQIKAALRSRLVKVYLRLEGSDFTLALEPLEREDKKGEKIKKRQLV